MGDPPTARDYINVHRVDCVCPHCDRWRELDLAAIIAAGQGDVPLINLPLRCSACGRTGHKIIVSGPQLRIGRVGRSPPRRVALPLTHPRRAAQHPWRGS
jgi:hypothetical protein